ncbi:heavy metal translocating P-type ATPase [Peptostreptococcus sp.]|uniref:heavy metal translocating P-type ATPase n=1 Tax=Peptostreptococcus sp. TaxID=1262 RepID=UPI002FCA896B
MGGLNCANCASKIEDKVSKMNEIEEAHLNFIKSTLNIKVKEGYKEENVVSKVTKIVDKIEPGLDIVVKDENYSDNKDMDPNKYCSSSSCSAGDHDHNDSDGHNHEHGDSDLKILLIAISLYAVGLISNYFGAPKAIYLLLLGSAYIISGFDVIKSAVKNLINRNPLDENFLMTIATVGAIAIGQYPEAVGVMLFYGIGEYLESRAVNKSRKNIEELMNIKPDVANLIVDGEVKEVAPENIKIGDHIMIKVGEKVPLDGIIIKGESRFDTSAITGESVLKSISQGEEISSGVINKNAVVEVEVTKTFKDSTVSKILDMVENATSKKSETENFITVFARYYTPVVVALAIAVAILPPIFMQEPFSKWLYRGLVFLVVSCPCALVISIPLSYFSGIGVSSKNGILVKGSNYLEALKKVDTVVMDKTGTITKGVFDVTNIVLGKGIEEKDLLKYANIAESRSSHPIANSISNYCKDKVSMDSSKIDSYEEIASHGIKVGYEGKEILAGNARLMTANNIDFQEIQNSTTKVYIAVDKIFYGCIEISDQIKDGMRATIQQMKSVGINKIVMLTGDSDNVAREVSDEIGIDSYYAELLPNDKVDLIENIISEKKPDSKVAFIGDGINDAPVIARADVGISMGGVGSDAAIEASDVVFMTDEVSKIVPAVSIARLTGKIVWQNIIIAIGIKVLVLILSTVGLANMWAAIFADVGVTLIAVLNSLRVLRYK